MTRRAGAALAALALLTAARLAVAGLTPLSPDEAYYWVWSRAPALSYLDHPPMVAWFISLGTFLAGDTPLGIRLLSPLSAALGSLILVRAADRLFPQARPGILAAALLNATLAFGVGSVTMTPDTPLLLFWTVALAGLSEVATRGRGWAVVGLGAGLALLSKYTAVLLAPSILAWLVVARGMRPWLLRWQPWAAASLAGFLFVPVLWWNAAHDWASFGKQGGRAGVFAFDRAPQFLGELIGGQFGLATPIIAVLCAAGGIAAIRRARDPSWGLLAALTLVPSLVFLEHALGDRVQANWPGLLYPSAAIAAAMLGGRWVRFRRPGIALGFAITALVWLQGVAAPLALPMRLDPTLMRLGGWADLADAIAARAAAEGASYVATDGYAQAAMLARLLPPSLPMLGVEDRWAYFNLPSAAPLIAGQAGLLVRSARRDDRPETADWSEITELGEVVRSRSGMHAETYRLYRVVGRKTAPEPVVVLPKPR